MRWADQLGIDRLILLLFKVVPVHLDQSLVGVVVVFLYPVLVGVGEVKIAERRVLQVLLFVVASTQGLHDCRELFLSDRLTARNFRMVEDMPQLGLRDPELTSFVLLSEHVGDPQAVYHVTALDPLTDFKDRLFRSCPGQLLLLQQSSQ